MLAMNIPALWKCLLWTWASVCYFGESQTAVSSEQRWAADQFWAFPIFPAWKSAATAPGSDGGGKVRGRDIGGGWHSNQLGLAVPTWLPGEESGGGLRISYRRRSWGSFPRMLSPILQTLPLLLLLLGSLHLQGKVFHRHHLPNHNLEESTKWSPVSKSRYSPPNNVDRNRKKINRHPVRKKFDLIHQRDKTPGAAQTNSTNLNNGGDLEKEEGVFMKRHGLFKVNTAQ